MFIRAEFYAPGHTDFSTLFLLAPTEDSGLLAASVISDGQLSIAQLASYCKQHLGVLAAEKFFLVDDFPRNLGDKVMRNEVCSHAKNMRDTTP